MNMQQRIEALKTQAASHPLTWNPKKGEYLVGVFKRYGIEPNQNRASHFVIEDDKGVLHRVALTSARHTELAREQARVGDLISIQYVGKERGYHGGMIEVFNMVVDKEVTHE